MQEKWQTLRRLVGYYPRVVKLVWTASPRYAFLSTAFAIIAALSAPAQIWLTKVIIDNIIGAVQNNAGTTTGIPWEAVLWPVGALMLVLVLGEVSQRLAESSRQFLRFQAEHYARCLLLEKAAQLDLAFYESATFYDQLDRANEGLWRVHNLARHVTDSAGQLLSLGVMLTVVAQLHPLAMVILLIVAIPRLLIETQHAQSMFHLFVRQTQARRMVEYLSKLLVSREAIKEIRLFGLQRPFLDRFRHFWQQFFAETMGLVFAQERRHVVLLIFSALGAGLVWIYAILQAMLGRITIGELTLLIQAVERVRTDLGDLFRRGGAYYEHSLFVGIFFGFLDLAADAVDGALAQRATTERRSFPAPIQHGIEFRNVSFRYPGAERLVLKNVSCCIPVGASVAVVGKNGAGKTTLVKLLARFYDPTEGVILLDGHDLRDYDVQALRQRMGVIFQDFVRYHLTAKENIGLGELAHSDDLERIIEAAAKGGAVPVIERLPSQYETFLGKTFEAGVDLSGGEWQKLALSRAFMRDAQILVLDEPTAALDALAESEVYQRFAELTAEKTTIFISHRFSTVRMAQQILVLEDGQLIEKGTHRELMDHQGQYAKMFSTQAERYL
ncbi:MAG: ABC transporter ATP-binding protein [Caldilineaceae bacterium]